MSSHLNISASEALDQLKSGNQRFASGKPARRLDVVKRAELLLGQEPKAVIIGCSDSRVPAEIVFDQSLGDLFVIRVAGNIVAPSQIGSVEFAVEQFGTRLVVVLGHSHCGAIKAAIDTIRNPDTQHSRNMRSIVDRIKPAIIGIDLKDQSSSQDPTVDNGYERKFTYVYGAVSPMQGELDWKICSEMNTEQMNQFLEQVSQAHPDEFIVMVVDGASSHRSKELRIPENIRLHRLPGYSPELNPQEHVWDELREKEFPNRVFNSMEAVINQLEAGLPRLAADTKALKSLTAWPWIISLILSDK